MSCLGFDFFRFQFKQLRVEKYTKNAIITRNNKVHTVSYNFCFSKRELQCFGHEKMPIALFCCCCKHFFVFCSVWNAFGSQVCDFWVFLLTLAEQVNKSTILPVSFRTFTSHTRTHFNLNHLLQ